MPTYTNLTCVAAMVLSGSAALPARAETTAFTPLKITKECSRFTAHSGDFCTITASDLAAIPAGSKVYYLGPIIGPVILATDVVVDAGGGNLALGYCNVELAKSTGTCTFRAGSGSLAGIQAIVSLTIDSQGLFHWDGGYALGGS